MMEQRLKKWASVNVEYGQYSTDKDLYKSSVEQLEAFETKDVEQLPPKDFCISNSYNGLSLDSAVSQAAISTIAVGSIYTMQVLADTINIY